MGEVQVAALRVHQWLDTSRIASAAPESPPVFYGVQARIKGERKWRHMAADGSALFFSKREDAEAWIAEHPPGPIIGRFVSMTLAAQDPALSREGAADAN